MKYVVNINNKNYEVEVERGKASLLNITEGNQALKMEQTSKPVNVSNTQEVKPASRTTGSGEELKAPLPGVVLDIKVSKGQSVKRGDILFILEAMKMENEITAPDDGVIGEIVIQNGASVNTGDILAVIQ